MLEIWFEIIGSISLDNCYLQNRAQVGYRRRLHQVLIWFKVYLIKWPKSVAHRLSNFYNLNLKLGQ